MAEVSVKNTDTVKDMNGVEVERGDLVTFIFKQYSCVGRVGNFITKSHYAYSGGGRMYVDSPDVRGYMCGEQGGRNNISYPPVKILSKEPPTEYEKDTFKKLRSKFKTSLQYLAEIYEVNEDDSDIDHFFWCLISPNMNDSRIPRWIIDSLTVSESDATHINWARSPEDVYNESKRSEGRLSRFLKWLNRQGYASFNESRIHRICTQWGDSVYDINKFSFELVSGMDLVDAYADGPTTCMKGLESEYGAGAYLYAQNPDQVQVLKISLNGQYKGRALVWTLDCGKKLLDRVYPGQFFMRAAVEYANQNGWIYRDEKAGHLSTCEKSTTSYCDEHFVTLPNKGPHYDEARRAEPYFDTMQWYDPEGWHYDDVTSEMVLVTNI